MKKICYFIFALLCLFKKDVSAQEMQILLQAINPPYEKIGHVGHRSVGVVQVYGEIPVLKNTNIWNFSFLSPSDKYIASVLGLSYGFNLFEKLNIQNGFGFGYEKNREKTGLRIAGFVYGEYKKMQFELYAEEGRASGFWYQSHLTFELSKFLSAGFFGQTESGLGFRILGNIFPRKNITLWSHLGYKSFLIGLEMSIKKTSTE